MPEHFNLKIRGYGVDFHVYIPSPAARAKVAVLESFFHRLPDQHLAVLYPIFVMVRKPGGRAGGGTWPPRIVRTHFMGRAHALNTGKECR